MHLMKRSFLAGGGSYAAVAALTNIPATLVGVFLYEFFLTDSDRGEEFFKMSSADN